VIRTGLAGLLVATPLLAATGQSPAARQTLDHFADSLLIVTPRDTAALRSTVHSLDRSAKTSHDPLIILKAGLAARRLGDLGADPGNDDAVRLLRKVTALEPSWPYAWQALGLAESAHGRWRQTSPIELGGRVGVGSLERAADCYRRALVADSSYAPAAVALSELVLSLHDTAMYAVAREALRRASIVQHSPEFLLAWGRIERAADGPDSALAAFESALQSGGPRSLELLELARTRLAMGRLDGERPYFEGAASDDSASVAGYREDLAPIASDAELAEFDASRGVRRVAFLTQFWARRDREELRADGERIREHYRRLLYARRNFALTVSRRYYGANDAYRSGSMELDDRGAIYVRHGEPAERLKPFVFGLMPSESWRYARADGDLLFHFSSGADQNGGGDLYDYRLVESVLDLHGASDAPTDQLLLSRQSLTPLYSKMLNWGPYGVAHARAEERGIGRASIEYGTTTDSYELQFQHRLLVLANLVAIGHGSTGPIAHFVFAVASPDSGGAAMKAGGRYAVRVRVAAFDAAGRVAGSLDTLVTVEAPRTLSPSEYLLGRAEIALPPGRWKWRAAVQIGEHTGVVLPHDSVLVARDEAGLALSDLAIGVDGASVMWQATPADTAFLTPFGMVPESRGAELYYEVSGARAGASYAHEIAVYRLKGEPSVPERRPVVRLRFDEAASGPVIHSRRTLQLRRLKPGRYLLDVRVSGPEGSSDERRREIRVLKTRG
jgi:GWxTD domain-containing protein